MKTIKVRCGAGLCRSLLAITLMLFAVVASSRADTNSWTKPANGFWEEQAYWSLGVLPDSTQQVLFNNPGSKALVIGPQTAQNFPDSMSVSSLRVGADADSLNVLMMTFAGFDRPLQAGSFTVDGNGAVVLQGSSLHVLQGGLPFEADLFVVGNFSQGDFSQVNVDGRLRVAGGSYFFTNGTLAVNFLFEDWGKFHQYGGANNSGSTHVDNFGEYHLFDGALNGRFLRVSDHGSFFQHGGTVTADVDVGSDFPSGLYVLESGVRSGAMIIPSARGRGAVIQSGGTNFATSLSVGNGSRFGGDGSYTLSNGVVAVSSSTSLHALGAFRHLAGVHSIASDLVLSGSDLGSLGGIAPGTYTLASGSVSAMNLSMLVALFDQQGGDCVINGSITLGLDFISTQYPGLPSLYSLSGGSLWTSNVTIYAATDTGFNQTGGTNTIASELVVANTGTRFYGYTLTDGSLSVNNITLSNGAAFYHNGGDINHSGVLTLMGGSWHAAPDEQLLGPVQLATGSTANSINSSIVFPDGASILRLAASRDEAWSTSATLVINNWHGSTSGKGATQLFFGSDGKGLTRDQLAQIKFSLPGGLYPARRLATGEVVPQIHRTPVPASATR